MVPFDKWVITSQNFWPAVKHFKPSIPKLLNYQLQFKPKKSCIFAIAQRKRLSVS